MVGAEEIDFFAGCAPVEAGSPIANPPQHAAPEPRISWTSYSVPHVQIGKAPLHIDGAPFAATLEPLPAPYAPGPFRLHLFTPLPPVPALGAAWSL